MAAPIRSYISGRFENVPAAGADGKVAGQYRVLVLH